ncbi:MAG TPA: hypothetical protein PLT60_00220 [Candidatus Pacearchaeota archaeon]|jgi:phosphoglycerol transferase MdoB-like AlkP superfamily enzyme|nr:hypothetical protein [Candidatus Pacearchaeota archaeon]HOH03903.1 hypothetical protein [Candidatus Pacearchaeota archaeon]HPX74279.1 hypothetical protein [Candidatus Pacearchaeota archaeon]HQC60804.1 hypothetical protein [Candidatus Pacearchaeota archaeon]
MINPLFFYILGIIIFVLLLIFGLKFSKYKIKYIKYGGYLLIIVGLLGLVIDLYNIFNKYLMPSIINK